jgi:hypothetical protein
MDRAKLFEEAGQLYNPTSIEARYAELDESIADMSRRTRAVIDQAICFLNCAPDYYTGESAVYETEIRSRVIKIDTTDPQANLPHKTDSTLLCEVVVCRETLDDSSYATLIFAWVPDSRIDELTTPQDLDQPGPPRLATYETIKNTKLHVALCEDMALSLEAGDIDLVAVEETLKLHPISNPTEIQDVLDMQDNFEDGEVLEDGTVWDRKTEFVSELEKLTQHLVDCEASMVFLYAQSWFKVLKASGY